MYELVGQSQSWLGWGVVHTNGEFEACDNREWARNCKRAYWRENKIRVEVVPVTITRRLLNAQKGSK